MRSRLIPLFLLVSAFSPLEVIAQQAPETAAAAVERVRNLYFMANSDEAAVEGERLIKAFPQEAALRAWTALALSRNTQQPRAMAIADSMAKRAPNDMWSHFARAVALAYAPAEQKKDPEAMQAAERARSIAPRDQYAVWVHAYVLANQRKYDVEVAMLDSMFAADTWVELRNMRASALMNSASPATPGQAPDTMKFNAGLAAYAETRKLFPDNFNAHYLPGSTLSGRRRTEEAIPLLERAAALAPYSGSVHSAYWYALQGKRDMTAEQRSAIIIADADRLLRERGHSAAMLQTLRGAYAEQKQYDKMHEVENRILREHPGTEQEAWVYISAYRAVSDSLNKKEIPDTAGVRGRMMKMQWDFVDRPTKITTGMSDTYLSLLFGILSDTTVPPKKALQVVQNTAKYNDYNPGTTHSLGPMMLADRGIYLKEAEAVARAGIVNASKYMEKNKQFYSEGDYLNSSNSLQAVQLDALGWVLYRQGKKTEALKELNRALEYNKNFPSAFYHLGQIAERDNRYADAEQYYAKGRGYETMGLKKNTEALKALFTKQHGSLDGYDAYANGLDEKDRDRRWTTIVDTKEKAPKAAPAFALERIDGARTTLAELKGKFVIVNFWGVWCGPCVYETPELQKLYDRLKADPDVVFVTIANDQNPQTTKDFMIKRKFTFPVLLDDGFVAKTGISAFPTTWFIDRDGNIQFVHKGASDVVMEEFLWRVDLLRGVKERKPIM